MNAEDFKPIIDDPEAFAALLDVDQLEKLITQLNDLYHNEGITYIPDQTFDALVWCLKKRKPKDVENPVGAIPRERFRDELPMFAPSLDKIKIGKGLVGFLSYGLPISATEKLDGVSGIIEYQDGIPINVYLRGNGKTGSNISHVLDYIDIPQLRNHDNMIVRGEFVMKKEVWNDKYSSDPRSKSFTTSRNFVCGKLNSGTGNIALQDIDFVAYDVMHIGQGDHLPKHSECLTILEDEGFKIVGRKEGKKFLTTDIVQWYYNQRQHSEYPIDGIVLNHDVERTAPSELKNPSDAVAFKTDLEEQMRITEVVAVDWRPSAYGFMIPVVQYKPVFIEGRRFTKATATNARRCVNEWKIGPGSVVKVTASGGVIPRIVEVLEESKEPYLPPKTPEWKWEGCNIVLCDIEGNPIVKLKRLVKFFETTGIPGIRAGMLTRMIEGGLENLQDILHASAQRLMQCKGIGPKLSAKYRHGIETLLPKTKLYRLMYASGCFPRGMGKGTLRMVITHIPNFLTEERLRLHDRVKSLYGIGPVKTKQFLEGLEKFKRFIEDFPTVVENNRAYFEELHRKGFNPKINGKKFVFTNLENPDLEDYIYDHRGSLEKAITEETCAVITGNPLELSTKTKDAQKMKIKVYTVLEFKQEFGVLGLDNEKKSEEEID